MKPTSAAASRYLLPVLCILVTVAVWIAPIDMRAGESVDSGMKRAFATFAVARSLNAAISVLQSVEVGGGPILVQGSISPGEALDPANDLVEQFGDLMLAATVSFGIQKVLLEVGAHDSVKWVLSALMLACAGVYVFGKQPGRWFAVLVMIGLMMRFAIPLAVVGSEMMFAAFLEESYEKSRQEIGDADELTEREKKKRSWWPSSKKADNESESGEVGEAGSKIEEKADYIVQLIVIFVVQTMIFPLLILWALYVFARSLVGPLRWREHRSRG